MNKFDFGSLEWNAYYLGRNKDGAKALDDRAKRARTRYQKALRVRAYRQFDDSRNNELALDAEKWGDLSSFDSWIS